MIIPPLLVIYFFYGLSFFGMGFLVAFEVSRTTNAHLRRALRPLAVFGMLHAAHEWLEMYFHLEEFLGASPAPSLQGLRLIILAFSFVTLSAFGSYLLVSNPQAQRLSLLIPLGLEAIWALGLLVLSGRYAQTSLFLVADVWTRYSLAIPASLLAAAGLIAQQRAFRRAGLVSFGQDALWAAVAFGWYGVVGQLFVHASQLPPSTFLNEVLFEHLFGFPVQIVRAGAALTATIFVSRFLRASQVEIERKIAELNEARLQEISQREALKGELFRRVVEAQEAERQRIARDLHDEIGQSLTAIGLGLRSLASLSSNGNEKTAQRLRDLEDLAATSLKELQRLIADLRPSHLDDLGLPAAIRWYIGRLKEHAALDIMLEMRGEEREICSEYATSIFRILQEALTNVVRHAHATQATVLLDFRSEDIHIVVSDNGVGFDKHQLSRQNSWGLAGMQERTSLLNGQMNIRSLPGKGSTVEIVIPYCPKHMLAQE